MPVRRAPDADYQVSGIAVTGMTTALTVTPGPGAALPAGAALPVAIAVPGAHNALNAAAALAAAAELGDRAGAAVAGLAAYRGAQRRMEPKGEADGVRVLDSYAHHPTELAADLRAAREVAAGGRVIAVFQPHLYSRTRHLRRRVRRRARPRRRGRRARRLRGPRGSRAGGDRRAGRRRRARRARVYLPDAAPCPAVAAGLAKPGDLVLTMGAGDVTQLGPLIVAALRARAGRADDGGPDQRTALTPRPAARWRCPRSPRPCPPVRPPRGRWRPRRRRTGPERQPPHRAAKQAPPVEGGLLRAGRGGDHGRGRLGPARLEFLVVRSVTVTGTHLVIPRAR